MATETTLYLEAWWWQYNMADKRSCCYNRPSSQHGVKRLLTLHATVHTVLMCGYHGLIAVGENLKHLQYHILSKTLLKLLTHKFAGNQLQE